MELQINRKILQKGSIVNHNQPITRLHRYVSIAMVVTRGFHICSH